MEVKSVIEKRRSVRKFQDREVPEEVIFELLEATRLAPSAWNAQPTRFVILKSKEIKETLKKEKIFRNDFVCSAPIIIVFCGDPEVFPKQRLEQIYSNPVEIAGETGAVRDVSIAAENLVLRASDLGLGTCYIGLVAREKIKEILGIPKNFVLPFVIIVGYPDETPKPTPRKSQKDLILKKL